MPSLLYFRTWFYTSISKQFIYKETKSKPFPCYVNSTDELNGERYAKKLTVTNFLFWYANQPEVIWKPIFKMRMLTGMLCYDMGKVENCLKDT
jgi:hypothetical protein